MGDETRLRVGDVVRLRSSGPHMTVTEIGTGERAGRVFAKFWRPSLDSFDEVDVSGSSLEIIHSVEEARAPGEHPEAWFVVVLVKGTPDLPSEGWYHLLEKGDQFSLAEGTFEVADRRMSDVGTFLTLQTTNLQSPMPTPDTVMTVVAPRPDAPARLPLAAIGARFKARL